MKKSFKRHSIIFVLAAFTVLGLFSSAWAVWSSWYFPWHDDYNPNLYDYGEAMHRYDLISGANAWGWEYWNHGPTQNPQSWWGHCHAWAAASIWEPQPTSSKTINGVTFRVRDRKGLLISTYDRCANGNSYELYAYRPSPGLFWRYLLFEVSGYNPMHGRAMAIIGDLYYGDEIWNYPIYKFHVDYGYDRNGYYGRITIYAASDESPFYADSTTLYYKTFQYYFSGVRTDSYGYPINSGAWNDYGPYSRPDSIWRPYYATTYLQYAENPQLQEYWLSYILSR